MKKTLDKHDIRLIRILKSDHFQIGALKMVWAERCSLSYSYVDIKDINDHLLDLIYNLNLLDNSVKFQEFILSLTPAKNHLFICSTSDFKEDCTDMQFILLSRMSSLFIRTNINKLPGYDE